MIININEDYFVKVENYCSHTLLKRVRDESEAFKVDKDKEPVTKVIGYYPNVRQALVTTIHLMLEDQHDVMELSQYLDELDKLESEFKPVLQRFKESD